MKTKKAKAAVLGIGLLFGACSVRRPREVRVIWTDDTPSCPTGYDLAGDQHAAIAGKDSAHCVLSKK
jgi:hypothetical protein